VPGQGDRLKRALTLILGAIALVIVTGFAMYALAKHRLATARITEDFVVVVATPGLSPQEAEHDVTEPLEQVISQVAGIDSIRSTTTSNVVFISVRATAIGVDARSPVSLVQEAVSGSLARLPSGIRSPTISRVEVNAGTRRWIAHSETMSRLELSRWLDDAFRRQVEVQQGVRSIQLCGALRSELKITLDQPRLLALGLGADDVVNALRLSSLAPPGGLLVRNGRTSMDSVAATPLKNGQVKLRDVATLELGGDRGSCLTASDVLVTVSMFAQAQELKLPSHPAVKLTPFTPHRTVTFLSEGDAPLRSLATAYPDAVIASENGVVTLMSPADPPLHDVPGFALRSVDEPHSVVRVSGPDLERLTELSTKLRELLAREKPRWLGMSWPNVTPERVITPEPGARDVAQALRLALTGVETGSLEDGTRVVVRAGTSLEDALLPDGRPVRDAVKISQELRPAAILHVNRHRVVELEVGLDESEVMRVVKSLQLPPGTTVSVTQSPEL
jgi:multidrug efflux pump subunit AcrB